MFRVVWESRYPNIPLESEYRFAPPRRYRADFCHVATRTIIEIEGGTWTGGRHNRGAGYEADCAKYNLASSEKYRVFRLTGAMLKDASNFEMIADHIKAGG